VIPILSNSALRARSACSPAFARIQDQCVDASEFQSG
jgi:hypothetical protein